MDVAWFILLLSFLLLYVFLSGYEIGVGIITLGQKDRKTRLDMLHEVADSWDVNQTWLVLSGVGLWAGFPLAFGVLLPNTYIALIFMLFGLIARAASLEIISMRDGNVPEWYWKAFGFGALVAAFCQGYAVGSLVIPVQFDESMNYVHSGTIHWYPFLFGVVLVAVYVALGYGFLRTRPGVGTYGKAAKTGSTATLVAAGLGVLALVALQATDAKINLDGTHQVFVFGISIIAALVGVALVLSEYRTDVAKGSHLRALWGNYLMVLGGAGAFLAARFPEFAPGMTYADATAPAGTYNFLLVALGMFIPLVIGMNYYSHYVMARTGRHSVYGVERKEEVAYVDAK